ncbi:sensor domain-containing diguanylate cyclase [Rhizobium rhizosphaerae]|nr:GGDEF domain-containing protein [Xaviernesmea rhizosphaerae]
MSSPFAPTNPPSLKRIDAPPGGGGRAMLATRLMRVIFGCYLGVATLLTCLQMGLEYQAANRKLQQDIAGLEKTFSPGLSDAMWRYSTEVISGILSGMREMPVVTGIEVRDEKDALVARIGRMSGEPSADSAATGLADFFDQPLTQSFPLVHVDGNGVAHPLGQWTVYSDRAVVFEQLKRTLIIVFINSTMKTVMLWLIFAWVIRRLVGRPLAKIDAFVREIDADNLGARPLVLDADGNSELQTLAATLNKMVERLRATFAENAVLLEGMRDMNSTLMTKVAERTRELEQLAQTDLLTGLANRRKLDDVLERQIETARAQGAPLSVILGDVDRFKAINDRHGHKIGDSVLVAFAAILGADLRAQDTVGRWGGEEFMLICPQTDLDDALAIAESLRLRIETTPLPKVGCRTCSFGAATLRPGETADELVARADAALYESKHLGRNRVAASR